MLKNISWTIISQGAAVEFTIDVFSSVGYVCLGFTDKEGKAHTKMDTVCGGKRTGASDMRVFANDGFASKDLVAPKSDGANNMLEPRRFQAPTDTVDRFKFSRYAFFSFPEDLFSFSPL